MQHRRGLRVALDLQQRGGHGGAIGAHTFPGRVWKGMRMPGRMGHDRVTVHNLQVVRVDVDANLIMVKGAVPGPHKGIVYVRK